MATGTDPQHAEIGQPCMNGCKNAASGVEPCRLACRVDADARLVRDGLPIICLSCGRPLANVGEWCCGKFTTNSDVVDMTTSPGQATT